ncbi:hypothetical protein K0M31_016118 [Melipona bicolor]|uniref:Uncharacterized protein n=1 Tax=Melipona bicolor TaxID=60889 RepID=A0AA40G6K3_9HYME|nr:hypothetical protein K0M31_016118 [Melipona bicolor]
MNSKPELLLPDNDAHKRINSNIIKRTMISQEVRDHDHAGGILATSNGKQQQQDECVTSDHEILGSSDSIEIPQMQCLLNQVSHENNVTRETVHIQNSLPNLDSKKLKSEAYKTLSNLLLNGERRNEISEQNDSGICMVTSSENMNPYDKSPNEKGMFASENQQEGHCLDNEDTLWNTSYSCSNLSSPKRKSSTTSDGSCVCSLRIVKTVASLDHAIGVHDLHAANNEANATKHIPRISSNFDGTNEQFVGAAYGNGQISVYDSNQSSFQINCTWNWENLSSTIDASTSRKEFWIDLKCENVAEHREDRDEERAVRSERHRYVKVKKNGDADLVRRLTSTLLTTLPLSRSRISPIYFTRTTTKLTLAMTKINSLTKFQTCSTTGTSMSRRTLI